MSKRTPSKKAERGPKPSAAQRVVSPRVPSQTAGAVEKGESTDLSQDSNFRLFFQTLRQWDHTGLGSLTLFQVERGNGRLGPHEFTTADFQALDEGKEGALPFQTVAGFLYPHVREKDLWRHFVQKLGAAEVLALKKRFDQLSAQAPAMLLADYPPGGELVCGMLVTRPTLQGAADGEGLTFRQFLHALFPSVPSMLIKSYNKAELTQADYLEIRGRFDMADKAQERRLNKRQFVTMPMYKACALRGWC